MHGFEACVPRSVLAFLSACRRQAKGVQWPHPNTELCFTIACVLDAVLRSDVAFEILWLTAPKEGTFAMHDTCL